MTFGLPSWIKSKHKDLNYEVPVWYPSHDQPDQREWLITNGLGGYSSSTISWMHTRRYHGALVSALKEPVDRHVVLSTVQEELSAGGGKYELSTNHWASGVVAPTGYRFIESFTTLPTPTWVYNLDGNYLIKQIVLAHGTNDLQIAYHWMPNWERSPGGATLSIKVLTGFRSFHNELTGSADKTYAQNVSANQAEIRLNGSPHKLHLSWAEGKYQAQSQWWWSCHWTEEAARGLPDQEDLFLLGTLTAELDPTREINLRASLDCAGEATSTQKLIEANLARQNKLISTAALPRSTETNLLVLACDQFLVRRNIQLAKQAAGKQQLAEVACAGSVRELPQPEHNLEAVQQQPAGSTLCTIPEEQPAAPTSSSPGEIMQRLLEAAPSNETASSSIIAGYPWFNDAGREAMLALPGLLLATRRFDEAKKVLDTFSGMLKEGVVANRLFDDGKAEYQAADPTLWWAWSLYHYYRSSGDLEFIRRQFPLLAQAAGHFAAGTVHGIAMDPDDALLRLDARDHELTWMDALVTNIPITPRSGKPVEICALWYNLLETLCYFAGELKEDAGEFKEWSALARQSMQKFWNGDRQCLYDVIEPLHRASDRSDDTVRPNQILAVSLPFRAFTKAQGKAVLSLVEQELLTPIGLRSLSPTDPSYQSRYGCGFSQADQYHRDLSYHQGTVWTWLMGAYCDAVMNINGQTPEIKGEIRILLQPLLNHMMEDACVGSISEIFDGSTPHTARGCFAHSTATAEIMRILASVLKS